MTDEPHTGLARRFLHELDLRATEYRRATEQEPLQIERILVRRHGEAQAFGSLDAVPDQLQARCYGPWRERSRLCSRLGVVDDC
jgi:hypothetical protein